MTNETDLKEFAGGKYLLDGYQTLYEPREIITDGKKFYLQYYQKKHRNEYVIKNKGSGDCYLYKNGLLQMIWKEKQGKRKGEFAVFESGVISFIQDTDNLLNRNRWIRKVNSKRGELMELWDGGRMVYRGDFDKMYKREGVGIAYDKEADIEYEGIFKNDVCVQILKVFEGDEMIELRNNGNNVNPSDQVPIYVGGYTIDTKGEYIRHGVGYLIDCEKRIASDEIVYSYGKELKRRKLFNGWYHENDSHSINIPTTPLRNGMEVFVKKSQDLVAIMIAGRVGLNSLITNLIVSSDSCNDLPSLTFNQFKALKTLEVGDNCFANFDVFLIDGLDHLEMIKIGTNSFTRNRNRTDNNPSRSFHVLNCAALEIIEVGRCSFSDYGGKFELKNLPKLQSIRIGNDAVIPHKNSITNEMDFTKFLAQHGSLNFWYSSFVVEDLPSLKTIELGMATFRTSLSTVISSDLSIITDIE